MLAYPWECGIVVQMTVKPKPKPIQYETPWPNQTNRITARIYISSNAGTAKANSMWEAFAKGAVGLAGAVSQINSGIGCAA